MKLVQFVLMGLLAMVIFPPLFLLMPVAMTCAFVAARFRDFLFWLGDSVADLADRIGEGR